LTEIKFHVKGKRSNHFSTYVPETKKRKSNDTPELRRSGRPSKKVKETEKTYDSDRDLFADEEKDEDPDEEGRELERDPDYRVGMENLTEGELKKIGKDQRINAPVEMDPSETYPPSQSKLRNAVAIQLITETFDRRNGDINTLSTQLDDLISKENKK